MARVPDMFDLCEYFPQLAPMLLNKLLTGVKSKCIFGSVQCLYFSSSADKNLVILGTGWGAVAVLHRLDPSKFKSVTVISPRNYFLFTPLLPSVTVGTTEPRSIIEPVRRMLVKRESRFGGKCRYLEVMAKHVDLQRKEILCEDISAVRMDDNQLKVPYDQLVVAVGAQPSTFGTPGVEKYARFLKEMDHARAIRTDVLDAFETAATASTEEMKKKLLSFVVVGGGPTGVEFAGELSDFIKDDLHKVYPEVAHYAKVSIIQSAELVLNTFDEAISRYAHENFKNIDVDIIPNTQVVEVKKDSVRLKNKTSGECYELPYGVCVWAAGIAPREITKNIIEGVGDAQKNQRLIATDSYLQVVGSTPGEVFAIGDCSMLKQPTFFEDADGLFKRKRGGNALVQEFDLNGDGEISLDEFRKLVESMQMKYPQLSLSDVNGFFFEKSKGSPSIQKEDFDQALLDFARTFKSAPATAQVASRQGEWLGDYLSGFTDAPWKREDKGMMSYVGGNRAVIQSPLLGILSGVTTSWLWHSAYASQLVSLRTKHLVLWDWFKAKLYGRDTSRM